MNALRLKKIPMKRQETQKFTIYLLTVLTQTLMYNSSHFITKYYRLRWSGQGFGQLCDDRLDFWIIFFKMPRQSSHQNDNTLSDCVKTFRIWCLVDWIQNLPNKILTPWYMITTNHHFEAAR